VTRAARAGPWPRSAVLLALAAVGVAAACGSPAATAPSARSASTTTTTRTPAATAPSSTAAPPVTAPPAPVTTAAPAPAPTGGLRVGPGSLATYTVRSQPPPGTCHYRWVGSDPLPDPACTPGATNPGVTAADLATTVCARGWTATIRPPTSVTGPEKAASALAYDYRGPWSTAEYDHLVPLELGGDPNDPANLWLEPNDRAGASSFANTKDRVENRLRALVCGGQLPLAEAQRAIATDWVAALRRYGP